MTKSLYFHAAVVAVTIVISALILVDGLDTIPKIMGFILCMALAYKHQLAYYHKRILGITE